MWKYEKQLQYPVKIARPNAKLASVIISQLGGPNGEMGASTRYLQQRYSMPHGQVKGTLTDIGTEELAHMEIVSSILYQLTRNLTPAQLKAQGFDTYFVDHTTGVYPQAASGTPFSAQTIQVTGDPIADLFEDLAAEQKARVTYDNLLRLIDDPDVLDPIRFLRAREVVHFQRFGEALRIVQDSLNSKNFYAFNPGFDTSCLKLANPCPEQSRSSSRTSGCPSGRTSNRTTDCVTVCTTSDNTASDCGCGVVVSPLQNGGVCCKSAKTQSSQTLPASGTTTKSRSSCGCQSTAQTTQNVQSTGACTSCKNTVFKNMCGCG